ncbi:hypothetical protein M413DRAFT_273490 [Hebeloma cylindrosporum]|uniref:Uncharacterized protein n=1 Tax=Hebeloma cylindrosporum TaxID=76867 RepID=A0A0C2Z2A2_HEBCY|nr:hypothetical protein M413DRAFT_273490 [Hebeloma cylindrosporum h7]
MLHSQAGLVCVVKFSLVHIFTARFVLWCYLACRRGNLFNSLPRLPMVVPGIPIIADFTKYDQGDTALNMRQGAREGEQKKWPLKQRREDGPNEYNPLQSTRGPWSRDAGSSRRSSRSIPGRTFHRSGISIVVGEDQQSAHFFS